MPPEFVRFNSQIKEDKESDLIRILEPPDIRIGMFESLNGIIILYIY